MPNWKKVVVSGSDATLNSLTVTNGFNITGSASISGSLNVANGITGSLFGTSSYAITASYALNAISSSYSNAATSASYALTASYTPGSGTATSASYALTASNADLLDGKDSSIFATTGSNIFLGTQTVTGSLATSGSNTLVGNTVLSGSVNISGSTTQVGNNTLIGNTLLTGSITISGSNGPGATTASIQVYGDIRQSGYHRFDPVNTNIDTSITASYIYVSGSTQDLYFSQNGNGYNNVTRLRWLEGNLYSGLLHGGVIGSSSSTVYTVSSGSGIVVNLNASLSDNPYPTIKYITWNNLSASISPLSASYDQTFIGINDTGSIYAQGTPFSDGQFDTLIPLGIVLHQNNSTINGVKSKPSLAYGWKQRSNIFISAFGPLKLSGHTIIPSSSFGLTVGSGTSFADGSNYGIDPNNPSYVTDPGTAVSKIFRYRNTSSYNDWVYDTNAGAGYTTINPGQYSNNGVLSTVANNRWSIQRCFWYPNSSTKAIVVYYGNAIYTSDTEAIANIQYETFVEAPNTAANAIYLGSLILRGNAVFTDANSFSILPGGLFRQVGGSGGGGSTVTTTLSSLSDVLISGPTNHQPFAYDTTAAKWTNQSAISASLKGNADTATSASYALTASYAIRSETADVASSATNAANAVNALTASYITGSNVIGRVSSATSAVTATSASYATTASLALKNIITASSNMSTITFTKGDNTTFDITLISNSGSVESASYAISSSYSLTSLSASYALTASYVKNAVTASYVLNTASSSYSTTASLALRNIITASANLSTITFTKGDNTTFDITLVANSGSVESASYAITASHAVQAASASYALTASYVRNAVSASYANSATNATNATNATSASYSTYAASAGSSLSAATAATAATASSADNFLVRGTLTAQTINVQTITSSIDYVTGSTRFGSLSSNTHQFTGSVSISGSLNVPEITGSLLGTASYATTASLALKNIVTASANLSTITFTKGDNTTFDITLVSNSGSVQSASYASTASYVANAISASYALTASYVLNAVSASYALSASNATNANTASYVQTAQTASYILNAISASNALTASYLSGYVLPFPYTGSAQISGSLGVTGSINISSNGATGVTIFNSDADVLVLTGSFITTGSMVVTGSVIATNGITGSLFGTASYSNTSSYAETASYALTASYTPGSGTATSASYALTASYSVTSSNAVSASYALTASNADLLDGKDSTVFATTGSNQFKNSQSITGSLFISGSTNAIRMGNYPDGFNGSITFDESRTNGVIKVSSANGLEVSSFTVAPMGDVFHVNYSATTIYNKLVASGSVISLGGFTGSFSGSLQGTSSYAETASYALSSSPLTLQQVLNAGSGASNYGGNGSASIQLTNFSNNRTLYLNDSSFPTIRLVDNNDASNNLQIDLNTLSLDGTSYNWSDIVSSTSSYALTASYAMNAAVTVSGSNIILNQTASATTWSFNHGLGNQYPVFQVFDSNNEVIIPTTIKAVDDNSALIYFSVATSGKAVASIGGQPSGSGGGSGAGFPYSGSAEITGSLAVTDKVTSQIFINPQNITYDINIPDYHNALIVGPVNVSSSINIGSGSNLLILDNQIATTGSNTFTGNQTISGSLFVTTGITGSLSGTASYALTASYAMNAAGGNAETASHADSGFTFADTLNKYATVTSSIAGLNNLFTESTGSYRSGFYKYTVYSGSNARTGEIMAVWNGGTAKYTETSTTDIGSTNAVTASIAISGSQARFNINTSTSGWVLRSTVTYM
jgi:hypothetical protein